MADKAIEVLLDERRNFPPPKEFKKSAHIKSANIYNTARKNPQAFWAKAAKDLYWFKPWKKVHEWKSPWAKWFIGGKLNASYNCLDRHVNSGRKNKAAIIWEGEPGDERVLTYRDVWREVNKFANVLKKLGVKKGDRVCLYMGMVPELVIAMHACNRIGAPHSVVFGGFSAEALRDRINDAEAKVLVTADGGYRRGTIVPLKKNADEAMTGTPSITHCVVVRRVGAESGAQMKEGRDLWWDEA
ncbi:MAG TPA: AMP-binding protein, partial [Candidatus Binatus sp.]|nr:AMP-binding protein [Candidatus Binatus sp.]